MLNFHVVITVLVIHRKFFKGTMSLVLLSVKAGSLILSSDHVCLGISPLYKYYLDHVGVKVTLQHTK